MSDSDLLTRFTARAPALAVDAPRVFAASRFVREACARLLDEGESFAGWAVTLAPGTYADALAALATLDEDAALMRALRRYRRAEMARIAFRDLAALAPLDETLADLSGLAEACIDAALAAGERRLQARHGVPRDAQGAPIRPTVLGMGKLGGRELNFSSDVDLIFCHRADGETDGARALSSDEYFAKLAQDVQKLLAAVTEDGFVFRVDLMLRPFGSAGALSASFAAFEEYYQVHGREWERYALIKARPVAGDIEAGRGLLQTLRPFVYRRYLDYNAIGSLRELKRLIADDVARRGQEDNVKLGSGGIRELEFIVQSFQLVRGGAEGALRDTRLRPVLRYLGETGHLDAAVAAELDEAYVFLRRLENAIQMYADQQTHALPRQDEARAALCAALDVADWAALEARLDAVRRFVQRQFDRIFAERGGEADGPDARLVRALWFGLVEGDEALEALASAGFARAPQPVLEAFGELRGARLVRAMSEGAQQKLLVLLGALLAAAREQDPPETALCRTLGVVQALAGRSTYIALLHDNAVARTQLVRLCAASPWLTAFIAQSPVLLDTLLDTRSLYAPPDPSHAALARDVFGCTVLYDQEWSGLSFALAAAEEVTPKYDPLVLTEAVRFCIEELNETGDNRSAGSKLEKIVLERLPPIPHLTVCARLLGTTPRTLHRRLIEEGTSYREIVESIRHRMALKLLRKGSSIKEVTYFLGYADIASFRRAFRRWEGMAPSDWSPRVQEPTHESR